MCKEEIPEKIILKVNLFWVFRMQAIENIPKNPEHVDNVPKRPENPDCNVQKVYPKFRNAPVRLYRTVTSLGGCLSAPPSVLCNFL